MVLTVTRSSQPWPLLPLASRRGFPSVLGCNFSPTNSLGSPSSSQFLRVPQDWVWAHLFLWFLWFKTPVVPVRDEFPQHSTAQPPGRMPSPQIHHVREWTPPRNLFLRGGVLSSVSLTAPGRYLSDTLRSAREVLRLLLVAVLLTTVKEETPRSSLAGD